MKKALITGLTGQDGSYLAEFLLKKGYEVYGMHRRTSMDVFERIGQIKNKIYLVEGDMTDSTSLIRILKEINPDEIYNLAAQSFVPSSWTQPISTADITAVGVLRILEAINLVNPKIRFYQASSSEMFGKVQETPQTEKTPFYPRSPYGVAKVYGYWITVNYRESYNIFACNGILFNHESIPKNSPIILNFNGEIDVLPIEDLFRAEKHRYEGILKEYKGNLVWNGTNWTKIISGTCYRNIKKPLKLIQTRESCYESTYDHVCFDEKDNEIKTKDLKIGDKVFKVNFPKLEKKLKSDKKLAKFIGYVVGDGFIDERGGIRLTGTNKRELIEVAELVTNQFGWTYRLNTYGPGKYENCEKDVWQLDINNDPYFGLWLKRCIYTQHSKEKKVPMFILNSDVETKKIFFEGYYLADGRNKGNEKYKYKGFTTKSATLCLGLILIFKSFSNQTIKCKCEYRDGRRYYYVQFRTSNSTYKGRHLRKKLNEIIRIIDTASTNGWFFDIQTESQTFVTGPNLFKIHNSPRRGKQFVTRKITHSIAKIKLGLQDYFELGNIDSKRDWGYAGDYVEAMWLMLQQDKPDDYVISSGETHSVREFVEAAFKAVGMNVEWEGSGLDEVGKYNGKVVVKVNPKFYRPAEVDILLGDSTKARTTLKWEPKTSFQELVKMMVESDLKLLSSKK